MKGVLTPNFLQLDDQLPEVVFVTPGDNAQAKRTSRLQQGGRLRPLYRGVYSSNLRADDADVVRRNWSQILSYLAPGVVLSYRSAFDVKAVENSIYISRAQGRRDYSLPGLAIKGAVNPKRGPLLDAQSSSANDVPYQRFYVASQARAYLENLTPDKRLATRQLTRSEVENRLERTAALRGRAALIRLREDAGEISTRLDMVREFKTLDGLIGALLGTRPAKRLSNAQSVARALGQPYDAERHALFEDAAAQLRNFPFTDIEEPAQRGTARDVFAFVESYFSNYIEGTTFTIEEAEEIIFQGKLIALRNEDSHDVKGTFEAAQRDPFYSNPPNNVESFLEWLRRANAKVMSARPEKNPGQWKERANQAGNTEFVLPELVPQTLRRAWPLFATLSHPMQRALLGMFVVAEVHPFADGNGRTARLLMNCFLSHQQQCRITVPTVFREHYVLALKALTHQKDATAYIRAMRLCQAWAAELDYDAGVRGVDQQLIKCQAKQEDTRLFRLLSPRTGELMAVPG
ncbi:MAG TPA: Fic family protein [Burkholderiaceae bacterium]|jgi:Fic family protein|nr:Fic family protein [Burkholderiaceae bacterium]